MECVKAVGLLEQTVLSDGAASAPDGSEYALNIAGVYQDVVTRDWAMQTCRWATQVAANSRVQNRWFDVHSLTDPGVFADAVRDAIAADVIVVSIHAADGLPAELCAWLEAWLPHRSSRVGALTALIGVTELLDSQSNRPLQYLQAVASKGRMDFIPQERQRPVVSPAACGGPAAEPASATLQALNQRYGPRYDAYCHRGLGK